MVIIMSAGCAGREQVALRDGRWLGSGRTGAAYLDEDVDALLDLAEEEEGDEAHVGLAQLRRLESRTDESQPTVDESA